ncbi:hypothetical protein [Nonomuraea wenchangensis]|uniref:hypothetical protein n=1 Tax=Nonomuraea wenchangensis TaxID=568860 RepID=UPI00343FAD1C
MEQTPHSGGEDAQTELLRDWADRQLAMLRHTYPAWEIEREQDELGQVWWTARLVPVFTAASAKAGVRPVVQEPDAIALAGTLAWQTALLRNARSRTRPL